MTEAACPPKGKQVIQSSNHFIFLTLYIPYIALHFKVWFCLTFLSEAKVKTVNKNQWKVSDYGEVHWTKLKILTRRSRRSFPLREDVLSFCTITCKVRALHEKKCVRFLYDLKDQVPARNTSKNPSLISISFLPGFRVHFWDCLVSWIKSMPGDWRSSNILHFSQSFYLGLSRRRCSEEVCHSLFSSSRPDLLWQGLRYEYSRL